jgi:SPP1 gp7 family putative phage head morphogenesis protein
MLRLSFMRELRKCFRILSQQVWDFMAKKDALGLKPRPGILPASSLVAHAYPREYEFRTDPQKVEAFNEWFRQMVDAGILSPDPDTPPGQPWTTQYVESAYRRGLLNAYYSGRGIVGTDQTAASFLSSSFMQPVTMSTIQLLGTRAFEELRGFSSTMATEMNRILAQGLADGRGAEDIAREMLARIGSLTESRAMTIARTEIINAHATGQLDAFERLGVSELGIKAEWSTAGDARVCSQCSPLEGQVFTVAEARGLIPQHPNCRCSWIPMIPEMKAR